MAPDPLMYKYPLDLTGINPNNLVINEPHTLPPGKNRAIVPNHGAYYTRSLEIRDSNNQKLEPGEQFKAVQLYQEATEKTGLEVATVIVVTDEDVSSDVHIDYQTMGGEFSYSIIGLREMIENLDLDNRPVYWGDIIGVPDVFPPTPHLHDAGDLYGFEYLVEALDAVRRAIQTGNEAAFALIMERINELNKKILDVASVEDALMGVRNDVIITPFTLKKFFEHWTAIDNTDVLNNHVNDYDNPHFTNAFKVGLSNLEDENPAAIDPITIEGTNYIKNLLAANQIDPEVALNQHLNETINPHQVNASDVGLNELENSNIADLNSVVTETTGTVQNI